MTSSGPQNTTEAVQHRYNVGGLFVWAVGEDDKNSSQVWTKQQQQQQTTSKQQQQQQQQQEQH